MRKRPMSVSSAGVTPPVCPQLSDELRVASTDIAAVAREGLLVMSVTGLQVMAELMDDELAGPAHVLKALSAPPSATQTCANVCPALVRVDVSDAGLVCASFEHLTDARRVSSVRGCRPRDSVSAWPWWLRAQVAVERHPGAPTEGRDRPRPPLPLT